MEVAVSNKQFLTGVCQSEDGKRFFSLARNYFEISEKTKSFLLDDASEELEKLDKVLKCEIWPTFGGTNMEDLYSKLLCAVLYSATTPEEPNQFNELLTSLQKVFLIDNLKHQKVFQLAWEQKDLSFLNLVLNMEILQVKGLQRSRSNGAVCHPFCVMFITPSQKFHTTIKIPTESPIVWREYFSFPVTYWNEETLHIEVWDHVDHPQQSLLEKTAHVESKNGLQFLKEQTFFSTASTETLRRVFLGCVKIPLQDVSTEGLDKFYPLQVIQENYEYENKGEIHLRMSLDAERDWKVAAQEYRQLLHLFLLSELDERKVKAHEWSGEFGSKHFEDVLRNFRLQGRLSQKDEDLAKFVVFSRMQCFHPLNAILFPPMLQNILHYIQDNALSPDEIRNFWFASENLVLNFYGLLREKLNDCLVSDRQLIQICYMLRTFEFLTTYLNGEKDVETNLSGDVIIQKTENLIAAAAYDLLIKENESNMSDAPALKGIRIGQLIIEALQKGRETLNDAFKQMLGIEYFDLSYLSYDTKYCELLKPIVEDLILQRKPLDFKAEKEISPDWNHQMELSTTLLKLYLTAKKFSDLSSYLSWGGGGLCIRGNFHHWFRSSVAHWLNISCHKAMKQIENAVRLDCLTPVDETVQFSSSAVDTATIFHQIRTDWSLLDWPEVEASYLFISNILNDLCRCTGFYIDQIWDKVEKLKGRKCEAYEVSDEVCTAINSIQRVQSELKVIQAKLELTSSLRLLGNEGEIRIAEGCEKTLIEPLMANIMENIDNKILEVLESIALKMKRVTCRYLMEAFEDFSEEHAIEKLMKYLDKNLIKLKQRMSQISAFEKIVSIIWEIVLNDLTKIMAAIINKRRPPRFFEKLSNIFEVLTNFFNPDGNVTNVNEAAVGAKVRKIEEVIELHEAPTMTLILRYYHERLEGQSKTVTSDIGMLTVRCYYSPEEQLLRVEILNAHKLKSRHSDGLCDSYVRVQIVAEDLFHSTPTLKTKVHKRTLFPFFQETFSLALEGEVMKGEGMIEFCVMDHDLLGRNKLLGECFLPFSSVPFTSTHSNLLHLPQEHLPLTVPPEDDLDQLILQVLDNRQNDRDASLFLKKRRSKMNTNKNNELKDFLRHVPGQKCEASAKEK